MLIYVCCRGPLTETNILPVWPRLLCCDFTEPHSNQEANAGSCSPLQSSEDNTLMLLPAVTVAWYTLPANAHKPLNHAGTNGSPQTNSSTYARCSRAAYSTSQSRPPQSSYNGPVGVWSDLPCTPLRVPDHQANHHTKTTAELCYIFANSDVFARLLCRQSILQPLLILKNKILIKFYIILIC